MTMRIRRGWRREGTRRASRGVSKGGSKKEGKKLKQSQSRGVEEEQALVVGKTERLVEKHRTDTARETESVREKVIFYQHDSSEDSPEDLRVMDQWLGLCLNPPRARARGEAEP